jgi:hypothetical protein
MVINTVQTNVQTSPPRASARAALSACTAFVESVARLTGADASLLLAPPSRLSPIPAITPQKPVLPAALSARPPPAPPPA